MWSLKTNICVKIYSHIGHQNPKNYVVGKLKFCSKKSKKIIKLYDKSYLEYPKKISLQQLLVSIYHWIRRYS